MGLLYETRECHISLLTIDDLLRADAGWHDMMRLVPPTRRLLIAITILLLLYRLHRRTK